jgi:hypothetical protein
MLIAEGWVQVTVGLPDESGEPALIDNGGGMLPGSVTLIGADIDKSTLLSLISMPKE